MLAKNSSSSSRREDILQELIVGLEHLMLPDPVELGHIKDFGGSAEVHEGFLPNSKYGGKRVVAVKRFRVVLEREEDFARVWSLTLIRWALLSE